MRQSKYVVNWKLLLGSVLVAAGLVFGIQRVHSRQVKKLVTVFKQEAENAVAKGDVRKAADYFRRYLSLTPNDHDTRARLGEMLLGAAVTPQQRSQAYFVLDESLRNLPERRDLRRTCAELAISFGPEFIKTAQSHLSGLIAADPTDGELDALYADTLALGNQYEEAEQRLAEAVRKKPDLYAAYAVRANILRTHRNDPAGADVAVEEMFESPSVRGVFARQRSAAGFWERSVREAFDKSDPAPAVKSFDAHLIAANYWDATGKPAKREEAILTARKLAPDELPVQAAVAQVALERAVEAGAKNDTAARKAALDEARVVLVAGLKLHAPAPLAEGATQSLTPAERLKRARVAALFEMLVSTEVQSSDLAEAEAVAKRGSAALPENGSLALALVDVQIRRGSADDAEKGIARLRGTSMPKALIEYQHARVLVLREDWAGAARVLEGVFKGTDTLGGYAPSALYLAGACYEQLGELDRRYEHYAAAAGSANRRELLWYQATERLGATLADMGNFNDAVKTYRLLATRTASANVPLARLLLSRTLAAAAVGRDWVPVAEAIVRSPEGVEAEVLKAEFAAAAGKGVDGKPADARDILTAAVAKYPKEPSPLLALAVLEFRAKNVAGSAARLAEVRQKFGDSADLRMTEAALLPLPSPDGLVRLAALADNLGTMPKADQKRLLRGLADLAASVGANDVALRLRGRRTEVAPDDMDAHLARFDAALLQNDEAAAGQALDRLRQLGRADGSAGRTAAALFQIWKAQRGDKGVNLAALEEELAAIQRLRPWWARVTLAQALVADLRGDKALAASRYREAIDANERRPEVVRRLLELYAERQQFGEAEALLRRLPERAGEFAGSELLVADLSARAGNMSRALEYAVRGIPEDSDDPKKLLYLAQLRRLNRRPDAEIEKPLRRAVQVGADLPAAWVALVQHLAAAGQRAEAETQAENAAKRLTGAARSLAVAQCRETLGHADAAKKAFAAAVDENPRDLTTLRAAAAFALAADDAPRVEELARRILDLRDLPPDDKEFALRLLAVVVSVKGSAEARREVLVRSGVLERGLPTTPTGAETLEQLRTRATVFAVQPDAALRRQAIDAFLRMRARGALSPEDELLLARLHISVGEWAAARRILTGLAAAHPANALYPASLVAGFLRFEAKPKEARTHLAALEKLEPGAARTVELTARVLDADGKPEEAVAALVALADKDPKNTARAAAVIEAMGQERYAEPLYRRLAADPARADGPFLLAGNLGRIGRTSEALDVVRRAAEKAPALQVAAAGVEILYTAQQIEPADAARVQGWLNAIPNTPANRAIVLELKGTLFTILERYGDAATQYRELVPLLPDNAAHLNNLAYLAGVREGKFDEALGLLERAKRSSGALPLFLDTEGLILLEKGDTRGAIAVLKAAADEAHSSVAYFHLALAHEKAGESRAALAAMLTAKRLKIRPRDVIPGERRDLARLLARV